MFSYSGDRRDMNVIVKSACLIGTSLVKMNRPLSQFITLVPTAGLEWESNVLGFPQMVDDTYMHA